MEGVVQTQNPEALLRYFSAALGRPIAAVQIPAEEWRGNAEKATLLSLRALAPNLSQRRGWLPGLAGASSVPELHRLLGQGDWSFKLSGFVQQGPWARPAERTTEQFSSLLH